MIAVLLTIHTLIVLALIVVVLLQRSDGGALGLGGGGGGFMSGRGAANALTRTTSILAALFFATSLGLAIAAGGGENEQSVIEGLTGQSAPAPDANTAPGETTTDDLLKSLGSDSEEAPATTDTGDAGGADVPLTEQDVIDKLGAENAPAETEKGAESKAPPEDADTSQNKPEDKPQK